MIRKSLKNYLEESGMTQTELAQKVGMSNAHLCEVIKGKGHPSRVLAKRISEVTGIPVIELLYPEEAA